MDLNVRDSGAVVVVFEKIYVFIFISYIVYLKNNNNDTKKTTVRLWSRRFVTI